jgi:hypothetical protein
MLFLRKKVSAGNVWPTLKGQRPTLRLRGRRFRDDVRPYPLLRPLGPTGPSPRRHTIHISSIQYRRWLPLDQAHYTRHGSGPLHRRSLPHMTIVAARVSGHRHEHKAAPTTSSPTAATRRLPAQHLGRIIRHSSCHHVRTPHTRRRCAISQPDGCGSPFRSSASLAEGTTAERYLQSCTKVVRQPSSLC